MEPECDKLIMEALSKNYIDMDEYPITTELQVGGWSWGWGTIRSHCTLYHPPHPYLPPSPYSPPQASPTSPTHIVFSL